MVRQKAGSRLFALAVAAILVLPGVSAAPTTHAQGSRTFPETGKTVKGRFLQYWTGHGGLAQQGFPISEEIQETSETNGKIYTVQYFERAVFEYHPENAGKPSEVLLQLLGTFLYGKKYPQGAPNTVPNQEPGSRLFAETGKRLGGTFLDYWNRNGGLAQQGFPISNEFSEKSDLDGKTYKVQYFERAVFEFHPEEKPPYNVLLSQLGTFRHRTKYAGTLAQLTGIGTRVTDPIPLKRGLTVFQSVRAGDEGYYYIDVLDPNGEQIITVAAGSGPNDESVPVYIRADGLYRLNVQGEEGWTVNITQPKATYAPPPAQQKWTGRGWQGSPFFSLKAGTATMRIVSPNDKAANAETPARVDLMDENGNVLRAFTGGNGPIDETSEINIPSDGVYMLRIVIFQADWTVEIKQ